jgi:hypothetical protein
MRKTIRVNELKEMVNDTLEKSTCSSEARKMLALFLSDVLHKTGNYHGFMYLPSESDIHAGFFGKDGRIEFI